METKELRSTTINTPSQNNNHRKIVIFVAVVFVISASVLAYWLLTDKDKDIVQDSTDLLQETQEPSESIHDIEFTDPNLGISIIHPSNWEIETSKSLFNKDDVIIDITKKDFTYGEWLFDFQIKIYDPMSEEGKRELKGIESNKTFWQPTMFKGASAYFSQEDILIRGDDRDSVEGRTKELAFSYKGKLYLISYGVPLEDIATVEQMINSLKVK